MQRKSLTLIVVLSLAGLLAGACDNCPGRKPGAVDTVTPATDVSTAVTPQGGGLVECPHSWIRREGFVGQTLPGAIIDVPEFHDCQRFLRRGNANYLGFFAIFAAEDLAARFDSIQAHADPPSTDLARAWAVGLIWSEQDSYDPLGIQKGLNCLYLYYEGSHLRAKMVQTHQQKTCLHSVHPAALTGQLLRVDRYADPRFRLREYPQVARWDWDPANGSQYIGIACGAGWCEVGPQSLQRMQPENAAGQREVAIKGWYDEQELALPPSPLTGDQPSGVRGVAIPSVELDQRNQIADFVLGEWVPAATLKFDRPFPQFASKLGIPARDAGGPWLVGLCRGDRTTCRIPNAVVQAPNCVPPTGADTWWAAIAPARDPTQVVYRCVQRRDHSAELAGRRIRGTVRWRWTAKDETLWVRCVQGCCTVQ